MTENKTKPTKVSVDDFLAAIDELRAREAREIIMIMHDVSKLEPVMWGPSIIGFGSQHYKYDSGREGDMPMLGFSPRKASITIYFNEGFDRYGEELSRLGKHKSSVSCLYITKLADVDRDVLAMMLRKSFAVSGSVEKPYDSVESYIAHVPPASRSMFDELRSVVRDEIPGAQEVLSYGIIGYKIDDKRARVFVSGWKDHVAMYPIPRDELLQQELQPYTKGKGTLWFRLDQTLPKSLIRRVVRALVQ
jgi:uncharacterized protein YdhG (YjbR/CyaY superfamily)